MSHTTRIPAAVWVLAAAVFAQGVSEFMLAGLIPDIARSTGVGVARAGLLTSAFAAGMVLGAPLMAVAVRRLPARVSLVALLSVFAAAHVLGAITGSFDLLAATRAIAALANAGFLAVALTLTTSIVAAEATGRAVSVLLSGTTVALVLGVPGGALLGDAFGWRSAFWAVAAAATLAIAPVILGVPGPRRRDGPGRPERPSIAGELRCLGRRRTRTALLLGALVNGATFCVLTYLSPLVTRSAGMPAGTVAPVLALFGVGAFAGVLAGGRVRPERAGAALAAGAPLLLAGWVVLALGASSPAVVWALAGIQGALAFGVGSLLIARILTLAGGAPTLAGASATVALNVGATIGPWLGGRALGIAGGAAPVWTSAALVGLALVAGGADRVAIRRRSRPGRRPVSDPAPDGTRR